MSNDETIHWNPESLRLLRQLKEAESDRREAKEALRKAKVDRVNAEGRGLSGYWRKLSQSPSSRREEKSRVAEEMERLEENFNRRDSRVQGIQEKLKKNLSTLLAKTPAGEKRVRKDRWLTKMETILNELDDSAARTLSALGRTRNTMTHGYDKARSAYPPSVVALFKESADRTRHFERKTAEYDRHRTHADRVAPKQGTKSFPKAWTLFESSLFNDIQNRPVAINSHELKKAQRLIQAIQEDFLPPLRETYQKVRASEDRRWSVLLEEKIREAAAGEST